MSYVLNSSLTSENNQQYNVYFTKEYDQFKMIEGNREINESLVLRLEKSISKNGYLMSPIFINEKHEVIDGQHRLKALKMLEKEVPFIILPGYNGKEMQVLNQTGTNWKTSDFMEYWITKDVYDYKVLKEFHQRFKQFSLTACIYLLSKHKSGEQESDDNGVRYNVFNAGQWEVSSQTKAESMADFLLTRVSQLHGKYNCINIIQAMMYVESNYPQFDRDDFIHKLQNAAVQLLPGNSVEGYVVNINTIYNHRRRRGSELKIIFKA